MPDKSPWWLRYFPKWSRYLIRILIGCGIAITALAQVSDGWSRAAGWQLASKAWVEGHVEGAKNDIVSTVSTALLAIEIRTTESALALLESREERLAGERLRLSLDLDKETDPAKRLEVQTRLWRLDRDLKKIEDEQTKLGNELVRLRR